MASVLPRAQCVNPRDSHNGVNPVAEHKQNEIRLQSYTTGRYRHANQPQQGSAREVKLFGESWIYKYSTTDTAVTGGRLSEHVV